jgi:DNA-binding response OmpR family regulator
MTSVLVVDDDLDLLEMVSIVLKRHEMNVSCINNGSVLEDSIAETRPDIILMDIYLGDSDGRNLCHSLKTSDQYRNIPVILYSAGFITSASIENSLADDFLVKPFDISKLINKIIALV